MRRFKKLAQLIFLLTAKTAVAQNIDIFKGINPQNPTSSVWKAAIGSIDCTAGYISFCTLDYGFIKKDRTIQLKGFELLLTAGVEIAVNQLLKSTINLTRSGDRYTNDIFPVTISHDESYPSGQTSLGFSMASTMTVQYRKWHVTVPPYLWAGAVGYSRIYFAKNYPSDVLLGAVLGVGRSWLSHVISNKLFNRKKTAL